MADIERVESSLLVDFLQVSPGVLPHDFRARVEQFVYEFPGQYSHVALGQYMADVGQDTDLSKHVAVSLFHPITLKN